jgi:hypothetical protein
MALLWIFGLIFIALWKHDSIEKKIKRIDNDPYYTIKSNDYLRKHGKL